MTDKTNTELVKEAIGYGPVLVSLAPGVGGMTYRTTADFDNLVKWLVPLLDAKDEKIADVWDESSERAMDDGDFCAGFNDRVNPYRKERA